MNSGETWGLLLLGGALLFLVRNRDQNHNPNRSKGNPGHPKKIPKHIYAAAASPYWTPERDRATLETLKKDVKGLLGDMWNGGIQTKESKKDDIDSGKVRWGIRSQTGENEGYLTYDKDTGFFNASKVKKTHSRKWVKTHLKNDGYMVK